MRRINLPPAPLRPDWRDPAMPVHATSNGKSITVTPQRRSEVSAHNLGNPYVPTWRVDPTYNLRRPK